MVQVLETNLFGVINGINAFLPVVQEAAKSRPTSIVITGSKQGITNPPGNPAYNASKAAVKTLAEHLSYDLRDTKTSVHLLVPGWTFTGMVSIGNYASFFCLYLWEAHMSGTTLDVLYLTCSTCYYRHWRTASRRSRQARGRQNR